MVQHRGGEELHQYWILLDQPDLWEIVTPPLAPLERYREQARAAVPDTSPLGMIRANRERNPWLEREYPAEGRIARRVEGGLGIHRPLSCLESQILAFQAARFPLFDQPSEIVAAIARRPGPEGALVKVYVAADGDSTPPKPSHAVAGLERDVAEGWTFFASFHNHTFNHSEERGLIPVAVPSVSDVQLSVALSQRLGLERVLVTDGFSTIELTADEVRLLWEAAQATSP